MALRQHPIRIVASVCAVPSLIPQKDGRPRYFRAAYLLILSKLLRSKDLRNFRVAESCKDYFMVHAVVGLLKYFSRSLILVAHCAA